MLITIINDELSKFPQDEYDCTEIDNPILTNKAPYKFILMAQNMENYMCCGAITGDVDQFKASGIECTEVEDIPSGYVQICLPPQYGEFLNIQQITTGLLLENKALEKQRSDIDFIATMASIDLGV